MREYRYGGFWRRGMACCIDAFILDLLFLVLVLLEIMVLPVHPYSHSPDSPAGMGEYMTGSFIGGHIIVFVIMKMAYFTYFHGSVGQTPGKRLLKLKVIRISGEKLSYGTAFLRWACYLISGIFLYLGYFWAAFDCKKQAWHDKIAGTLVILANNNDQRNVPQQLVINI